MATLFCCINGKVTANIDLNAYGGDMIEDMYMSADGTGGSANLKSNGAATGLLKGDGVSAYINAAADIGRNTRYEEETANAFTSDDDSKIVRVHINNSGTLLVFNGYSAGTGISVTQTSNEKPETTVKQDTFNRVVGEQ